MKRKKGDLTQESLGIKKNKNFSTIGNCLEPFSSFPSYKTKFFLKSHHKLHLQRKKYILNALYSSNASRIFLFDVTDFI